MISISYMLHIQLLCLSLDPLANMIRRIGDDAPTTFIE